jgi:hypothetical protein
MNEEGVGFKDDYELNKYCVKMAIVTRTTRGRTATRAGIKMLDELNDDQKAIVDEVFDELVKNGTLVDVNGRGYYRWKEK